MVYVLELLVSVLLSGVMALFAHQPPNPDADGLLVLRVVWNQSYPDRSDRHSRQS